MHRNAVGHTREEIVKQVEENEESVYEYKSIDYLPDKISTFTNL